MLDNEELEELCGQLLENATEKDLLRFAIKGMKLRVERLSQKRTYLEEFRRRFPECNMSDVNITRTFHVELLFGVQAKWRDYYIE